MPLDRIRSHCEKPFTFPLVRHIFVWKSTVKSPFHMSMCRLVCQPKTWKLQLNSCQTNRGKVELWSVERANDAVPSALPCQWHTPTARAHPTGSALASWKHTPLALNEFLELPEQRRRVVREHFVPSDNRETLMKCLSNQQPVEWIVVVRG